VRGLQRRQYQRQNPLLERQSPDRVQEVGHPLGFDDGSAEGQSQAQLVACELFDSISVHVLADAHGADRSIGST
jgi:hypothetical protein